MAELFPKLDASIRRFLRGFSIILFVVLSFLLVANVLLRLTNDLSIVLTDRDSPSPAFIQRLLPLVSMHWFDEIVEMCFAALVFYGAALLWATKGHFCVGDWISPRLSGERARAWYRVLVAALCVAFQAVFFWYSLLLTLCATELTTVFQIPKSLLYSCMLVSSFIMLAYSVSDLCIGTKAPFHEVSAIVRLFLRE